MAHAQKPDFVFCRNGRVHLNRRGLQFSRLLAAEVCASVLIMLDKPRSELVGRVLATHSIRQFPLHFPSRASPCAIRIQTHSTATSVFVSGKISLRSSNIYFMKSLFKKFSKFRRAHLVKLWLYNIRKIIKHELLYRHCSYRLELSKFHL
jgi:hypothetical protein